LRLFINKEETYDWCCLESIFYYSNWRLFPFSKCSQKLFQFFLMKILIQMWRKCMYDVYLEIIKWCHVLRFSPICRVFLFSHFCLKFIIYNLSCAPLALVNMLNHNKRGIFISSMTNKNNENILLWFFFKTSTMVLSNFTPMEQRFQFDLFTYLKPMTLATLLNHVKKNKNSIQNPSNHVA